MVVKHGLSGFRVLYPLNQSVKFVIAQCVLWEVFFGIFTFDKSSNSTQVAFLKRLFSDRDNLRFLTGGNILLLSHLLVLCAQPQTRMRMCNSQDMCMLYRGGSVDTIIPFRNHTYHIIVYNFIWRVWLQNEIIVSTELKSSVLWFFQAHWMKGRVHFRACSV